MEQTLAALGGILLRAVPTFLLVLLLHFYLKRTFFKPLESVLKARYDATEGARKAAEESLRRAEEKTAEYEQALQNARGEIYKEQETMRKQWRDDQSAAVLAARQQAETTVKAAREQLAAEVAASRQSLAAEAEALAEQITKTVLTGSRA